MSKWHECQPPRCWITVSSSHFSDEFSGGWNKQEHFHLSWIFLYIQHFEYLLQKSSCPRKASPNYGNMNDFEPCSDTSRYCWKKSQTPTWDVWNPVNNGINYQPQLVSRISFYKQYGWKPLMVGWPPYFFCHWKPIIVVSLVPNMCYQIWDDNNLAQWIFTPESRKTVYMGRKNYEYFGGSSCKLSTCSVANPSFLGL